MQSSIRTDGLDKSSIDSNPSSSTMSESLLVPVIVGIALGIGLIVVFSVIYVSNNAKIPENHVSIVIIKERAATLGSERPSFEPSFIRVRVDETVRWVNEDSILSSVVADESTSGSSFYNATRIRCENDDEDNCILVIDKNFLTPGKIFDYKFTKAGVYGYHSVPHPGMSGTVIVLPNLP